MPIAAPRFKARSKARSLPVTTAKRLARALANTTKHDFAGALRCVGGYQGEVAMLHSLWTNAAVVRANAWEKLGNLPAATAALGPHIPESQAACMAFIASFPTLALCAQTMRQSELWSRDAAAGGSTHFPAPGQPVNQPPKIASATLRYAGGGHALSEGQEIRVGRDAAKCGFAIRHGSLSSVHASFRLEAGRLWVRDERSTNGTVLNGVRLDAGSWMLVPDGSKISLGAVELALLLG